MGRGTLFLAACVVFLTAACGGGGGGGGNGPEAVVVTNLDDSGSGSLRQALVDADPGAKILFDPGLAGGVVLLSSGPLQPGKNVTIDAKDAPDLVLDGGGTDRVLVVDAGLTVKLVNLIVTNGYGWQVAGGILNNGDLTLDRVTVKENTMATDVGDYGQGGGGIYNGDGATLNLVDSSVSGNQAGWSGGGVFSFTNSVTTITRSTISGNVSGDVGGGLRLLGNADIVNSTISGNTATRWYGGAVFITDGAVTMTNVTVAGNISPYATPAAVFVGTFTDAAASLSLVNSVLSDNQWMNCYVAPWGAGTVTLSSGGHNVFSDDTCSPVAGDIVTTYTKLGPLAGNGGPTQTHALLPGSPAIDAGDDDICPATDQRGVSRSQGAGCDAGAYEFVP